MGSLATIPFPGRAGAIWEESPGSAEETAAVLAGRARAGEAVYPLGAGTGASRPPPPAARGGILRTERLSGVVEFEPGDLVLTAGAGMRLADLQAFLAPHRQFVPWDPPDADRATIGGLYAAGEAGPLAQRHPHPRHLVLGLWAALADGSVIHPGSKVVKSVAGLDLAKPFWGSRGTLGAIVRMTIRAYALPEAERTIAGAVAGPGAALALAASIRDALSCSRLEIVGAEGGNRGRWAVLATLAGAASVVGAQAARAEDSFRAAGASVRGVSAAEREAGFDGLPGVSAFRSVAAAAALARVLAPARGMRALLEAIPAAARAGAALAVSASPFAGTARVAADGEAPAVASALGELRAAAEGAGGWLLLDRKPEGSPIHWRGTEPPGRFLMRRLKSAFDPAGVLAPGWEP